MMINRIHLLLHVLQFVQDHQDLEVVVEVVAVGVNQIDQAQVDSEGEIATKMKGEIEEMMRNKEEMQEEEEVAGEEEEEGVVEVGELGVGVEMCHKLNPINFGKK